MSVALGRSPTHRPGIISSMPLVKTKEVLWESGPQFPDGIRVELVTTAEIVTSSYKNCI